MDVEVTAEDPYAIGADLVAAAAGARASELGAPDRAVAEATFLARYAMGRFGTLEEVANLVLFLTSAEASYVTGAAYTVDGGSVFH